MDCSAAFGRYTTCRWQSTCCFRSSRRAKQPPPQISRSGGGFDPVVGFASYRCEVVRKISSVPPQPVELRFANKLTVSGIRFREELALERWKGDRLQDRRRFLAASDGKRRLSFAEPQADASGTPKAIAEAASVRALGTLPCDPLWLTDSSPLLSSARNEECLPVALASKNWWDTALSKDSREIVLLEPQGNARRWSAWIEAGERTPRRIDGPAGLAVAATLSNQTFVGWRPLAGAVRESAALGGKTNADRTAVTMTVAAFAVAENIPDAEFAPALPKGVTIEDQTHGPPRLAGKKGESP